MWTAEAALQALRTEYPSPSSHPMSRDSQIQGSARDRFDSKVLDLEMDQCTQRLNTIQSTTEVASAVVAALADAGSRLQHCATASRKLKPEGASLEECLKHDDESMAAASHSFLDACGSLGAVLIGMASAISQNVMLPLESFHRHAFADHTRKAALLDELRRKELGCSNAVTESLQKRDRARLGLQSAMRDQEKTEKKAGEKKKGLARFARSDEKEQLKDATMPGTEDANEARVLREKASKDVSLLQSCIDFVRSRLLARCLKSSAGAWAEAAKELQRGAEQLRLQVSKLRLSVEHSEGGRGIPELPAWALETLKLSRMRPFSLSELNLDDDSIDLEDHPESPFTAPSTSLRSPKPGSPLVLGDKGTPKLNDLGRDSSPPAVFTGWPVQSEPQVSSTPFD
ncbi:unnamed protein product [Durusdinium trenchii]|uniref:Uncharacterized protein n=1 Tax=Durusdinium trenchii TaxID=1381693 RepID=A0ABP0N4Q9_9DINO